MHDRGAQARTRRPPPGGVPHTGRRTRRASSGAQPAVTMWCSVSVSRRRTGSLSAQPNESRGGAHVGCGAGRRCCAAHRRSTVLPRRRPGRHHGGRGLSTPPGHRERWSAPTARGPTRPPVPEQRRSREASLPLEQVGHAGAGRVPRDDTRLKYDCRSPNLPRRLPGTGHGAGRARDCRPSRPRTRAAARAVCSGGSGFSQVEPAGPTLSWLSSVCVSPWAAGWPRLRTRPGSSIRRRRRWHRSRTPRSSGAAAEP